LQRVTLIGQRVRFANGSFGVIGTERRESPGEEVKFDKLFIDIGATDRASAETMVRVGDFASFSRECIEINGRIVGKAMDDRLGCAILVQVLKELTATPNEVVCVFTTQEEVGPRGARTSAYHVDPVMAIALDVTFTGDTPEGEKMDVVLGKGPAIKVKDWGMIVNPKVKGLLIDTATAAGIPYQLEIITGGTTDASVIQTSRAGIPSGVISIPSRYIHTTSEMVDRGDAEKAVKLLVELLKKPLPEV
jgi:endoglucanase